MELGFISGGNPADLKLAQSIGYTTLELAFFPGVGLVEFSQQTPFVQALRDHPVNVSAVSVFGDPHPVSRDPAEARLSADRFKAAVDIAAAVKARVVISGTGRADLADTSGVTARILDVFGKRVEQAKAAGLSFAFYNCHWENVVDRPGMWARVLPHLDAGIKYDPSHPAYDGRDYLAELEEWGRYVRHAHAKDVMKIGNRMHADPNPGFGQIQWGPFFALLYEMGYHGAVVVEPHSHFWTREKREAGLRASYRLLSQFLLD